jgi:diguanylate cyclase (GGDEF)-like protein
MSKLGSSFRLSRAAGYALGGFVLFFGVQWLIGGGGPQLQRALISGLIGSASVLFVAWSSTRPFPSKQQAASLDELNFRAAAENGLDDFYIFAAVEDRTGRIVDFRFAYINPAAERRLHAQRENLLGRTLSEVRPVAISLGLIERYAEVVRSGVPSAEEVFLDDDRIHTTWLHVHAVKLGNGVAITSRDITERKRVTEHVSYLAQHDQLTGLANRTLLLSRLKAAITHAAAMQQRVAVFVVDLDNFKQINDSLGHMMGDRVLGIVAKRLLKAVRDTDTVARLGGDEFVIVMPSFKDLSDVERCAEKIVLAVDRPITIDGQQVGITISSGYSIYPDSGVNAEELIKNADMAMYAAKSEGRNGFRAYDSELIKSSTETLAW